VPGFDFGAPDLDLEVAPDLDLEVPRADFGVPGFDFGDPDLDLEVPDLEVSDRGKGTQSPHEHFGQIVHCRHVPAGISASRFDLGLPRFDARVPLRLELVDFWLFGMRSSAFGLLAVGEKTRFFPTVGYNWYFNMPRWDLRFSVLACLSLDNGITYTSGSLAVSESELVTHDAERRVSGL
jgi:hypothetical protein